MFRADKILLRRRALLLLVKYPDLSSTVQSSSQRVQLQLVRHVSFCSPVIGLMLVDHSNPAYLAIERETLTAVAPFLELAKKRGKAEVTTKVVQAPNSSGVADPPDTLVDPADEPCIIPPRAPKHQLSNSSITLDDLRIGSRIMPALSESRSCPQSQDHSVNTSPDTTPRSIFSTTTNQSTPESTSSISRDSPSSILASRSRAMSGVGDSPKYSSPSTSTVNHASPSSSSINYAYGLGTASPQQLELMQNRLRSLSITSESPRKIPTTSLVPVIAPDPSFLLTKFIHDSVRLYSPSKQEHEEKQRLQTDLEAILQIIQPTASLVVFGSVKNGLALANADLDLMVVDKSSVEDQLHDLHVDLPGLYAEALRSQGYAVKLLTKTRIPLIKILREYVAGVFSVDISFDNPLALHNTRLMATYNACDTRFGVLVMFIKLWARARRINDSFTGTLKSYGFMIMLIYYLQNKATPALLPNLQMISTSRAISTDELECQGFDIWYAKDVSRMHAIQQNSQSVGELVEGFFSHFAYEFDYRDVRFEECSDARHANVIVGHLNQCLRRLADEGVQAMDPARGAHERKWLCSCQGSLHPLRI